MISINECSDGTSHGKEKKYWNLIEMSIVRFIFLSQISRCIYVKQLYNNQAPTLLTNIPNHILNINKYVEVNVIDFLVHLINVDHF